MEKDKRFAARFIAELGGCAAVARVCGITKGAVWQWKDKGRIPKAQENFLKTKYRKKYRTCLEALTEEAQP